LLKDYMFNNVLDKNYYFCILPFLEIRAILEVPSRYLIGQLENTFGEIKLPADLLADKFTLYQNYLNYKSGSSTEPAFTLK